MTPFLAVFLPLLVAYGATLWWCTERWNAPTQYFAHGWLVPFVGAFVVWHRRAQWRTAPRSFAPRAVPWLAAGLLLHAAGALLMIDSWSAASLVATVPAAAYVALGPQRLASMRAVPWLVLFLVPMPIFVEGRVAFTLKEIAVASGVGLANLLGAGIVAEGSWLHLRGAPGSLYVADECGGLRSLLAMLTLAYVVAFFLGGPSVWRRVALLAAAPLLAVAANIARIALLCLLARHAGVPFAESTGHTIANAVEWATVVIALLVIDRRFPAGEARAPAAPATATQPRPLPRAFVTTLWLVAPLLLALSLWRPGIAVGARAERLPAAVAGHQLVPRSAEDERDFQQQLPRWRELLGTEDFVWRHYRDGSGGDLWLVALFHGTNWKSVHPPRICIEGSGMDIEVDDFVAGVAPQGAPTSRIVAKKRATGRRFVTLSLFGTRDWLSGDYWDFTWHHLPRALARASQAGFLLRVEAVVRDGESDAAAERRAAAFLQAIVPAARELLP